jgi:serine/threonine-protein kinase RsbW
MVANLFPNAFEALSDISAPNCRHLSARSEAEVNPLTDQFTRDLAAAGVTEKEIFGLRLAVEEAVVNGIKHGNRGDAAKEVRFHYRITAEQILLTVEDEGPGFRPEAVADCLLDKNLDKPSGRGVFLMRFYMTWVEFNERGNGVAMCKSRK